MSSKIHDKTDDKYEEDMTTRIPDEVLRGLSPEAVGRLKDFVEAAANFRRCVYGEVAEKSRN